MKINSFSITLFMSLFVFIPWSCKKDPICGCGVEHPEENLPWLKTKLATRFDTYIYQVFFEEVEYLIVCDPPVPDAMRVVYTCDGIKVCEDGGYIPGAGMCNLKNPETFWHFFDKYKILVYESR